MTSEEYIAQRVDDQIGWYDRRSQAAQALFKRLRGAEILCAAAIPVLAGFAAGRPWATVAIGVLGAVVVVLAAFQSLGQHHERWIEYRTTCESLKHEKYLFLTTSPPYDGDAPLGAFVERVEGLISKENTAWSRHSRSGARTSKPAARVAGRG